MTTGDDPKAIDRLRRVEALYHQMLARPPDQRAAALAAACPDDPELAAEIRSLLDLPESAADFLSAPALEAAAALVSGKSSTITGRRLGAFEVQGLLGVGGMGEVYRARDTRLHRSVAIKILPRAFKDDPDRLARFEREARILASLSHPHICSVYDVGREGDTDYLVMELVEGATLAARLKKGPLPLDQTLRTGIEIADALDRAHRQGVIHRDLKPGNVMRTKSGAKLMDFGLARLTQAGKDGEAISALPTASEPLTGEGTLLGTVPYMAPEQLEGKGPDARSDLWALGCVLYEMATGRAAFVGKSRASLISSIMADTPPAIGQLQPLTPPTLERLVKACLAKDPDDRVQTAHDLMQQLQWIAETPSGSAPITGPGVVGSRERRWRLVVGALALVGSVALGILLGRLLLAHSPSHPPIVRSFLDVGPAEEVGGSNFFYRGGSRTTMAWTPDGGSLVFTGGREGVQRIYVRALDGGEARLLEGTEGGQMPAVSVDSRWVAFWAKGAIRRVPLEGGPVTMLYQEAGRPTGSAFDLWGRPTGMAWGRDGRLFFATIEGGISSVEAERPPTPVTTLLDGELSHLNPHPLPDGSALLYTVRRRESTWGDEELVAHVFATGERKVLLKDAADARYLAPGHLVFLRRGTLYGVPFDLRRLKIVGVPVPVLDGVAQALTGNPPNMTGAGQFSVSSTGTLAWLPGAVAPAPDSKLVSVDRRGRVRPLNLQPRTFGLGAAISPDGRRLAFTVATLTEVSLWIHDLERGTSTKLQGEGENGDFLWTPDGQRVTFSSLSHGRHQLAWQRADGTGPREVLTDTRLAPSSWSPDGCQLAVVVNEDIWIATLADGRVTTKPFIATPDLEESPEFSPDGHWLAYASNVSGRREVYVQPYPGPGPRLQVSSEGGMSPVWNRSGRELLFLAPDPNKKETYMMSVTVLPGKKLSFGKPQRLFAFQDQQLILWCAPIRCFDVSPDGQLFYGVQTVVDLLSAPPVTQINLVTNWVEELKAKVSAGQAKQQ